MHNCKLFLNGSVIKQTIGLFNEIITTVQLDEFFNANKKFRQFELNYYINVDY